MTWEPRTERIIGTSVELARALRTMNAEGRLHTRPQHIVPRRLDGDRYEIVVAGLFLKRPSAPVPWWRTRPAQWLAVWLPVAVVTAAWLWLLGAVVGMLLAAVGAVPTVVWIVGSCLALFVLWLAHRSIDRLRAMNPTTENPGARHDS